MSGWGMGWFGGGGQQRNKDAPKNAILKLRDTMEMLNKRDKYLQNQILEQENVAKKNVSTNKNVAKAALRRKKNLETSLEQTQAQIMTLDGQIQSIETANINKETLDAMKNASQAMKIIHNGTTVDKVDQTMQDLQEQKAISDEINEVLTSNPMGAGAIDEDELDAELNELQQQELDDKVLTAGTVPVHDQVQKLPAAGNRPLPQQAQEEDEEAELQRLQAEMAV